MYILTQFSARVGLFYCGFHPLCNIIFLHFCWDFDAHFIEASFFLRRKWTWRSLLNLFLYVSIARFFQLFHMQLGFLKTELADGSAFFQNSFILNSFCRWTTFSIRFSFHYNYFLYFHIRVIVIFVYLLYSLIYSPGIINHLF